ncbi:MAG: lytic transglycosylase domain-containing protein [Candidatus Eremiobacteraeota bacterium]|nr:lytic transglycosylase domain-containing protein [Candidatus Eremiobacteraeota bacterium]
MAGLLFVFGGVLSTPTSALAAKAALLPSASTVNVYAHVLRNINPHLQQTQSRDLAAHVLVNATRWNIDANLLVALVTVESRWRPHARSRVGALGLGQLMPGTASSLGVNPRNAFQNLLGCARYLSLLIARYEYHPNHYALAFAAYNAGPKAVQRYGGVPPYRETQHYVVRVMRMWRHLATIVHMPKIDTLAPVAQISPRIQGVYPVPDGPTGIEATIVPERHL